MPVFFVYSQDGVQFDGCVASDAEFASRIIKQKYDRDSLEYVGTSEGIPAKVLVATMQIREQPAVPESLFFRVEQFSKEAALSDRSNRRKTDARLYAVLDELAQYPKV